MKNLFKYLFGLVSLALFAACTPETFEGANGDIPTLDGVEPVITVDQNLNQVTFSLPENVKGCMPVWILYENKGTEKEKITYSTQDGMKKIYTNAGDYYAEFKLMNRNGISDASKQFSFHIDNTIVNFEKYFTLLCGGKENAKKEWRIDNSKGGHLGCGEPNTTGLNWWSAGPDEKADFGVYENRLTFGIANAAGATGGSYTFNPGESGTIYVNKDVVALGGPQGEDFNVPATLQETTFEFEVRGDDLYIVFPAHTQFPYIANDDIWNEPAYRVESMTPAEINFVIDNGGIAWHYILTSGAAAQKFSGFKYNSDFNLWKAVDEASAFDYHYYYAPGWAQIADPELTIDGNAYTWVLPQATTDQWQAQCPLKPTTPLHLSADKKYDFSCVISSDADLPGVTVKLTDVNTGDNFVFVERVPVKAYEDYIFYVSDVNSLTADADVELFFDFGGNPDNTTVTVKNIVVKDHANDDGTVLPSDEPGGDNPGDVQHGDFTGKNLLEGMNVDITQWYAPGWNQIADAVYSEVNGAYTITYPEAASDQWMAQFTFNNTGIALDPSKKYDFRCKIVSSNDHPGVTVKLTQQDDDNTFITADRHAVKAYEETWVELVGLSFIVNDGGKGVINNLKMPFDFGGVAAGTEITISDMYLQEHKATADEVSLTWDMPGNLWANANVNLGWWYSAGDWSGQLTPDINDSKAPREYVVTMPAGIGGSEWMGQTQFHTDIPASASKTYNFGLTLNSTEACTCTVKLAWEGNDNDHAFFYVNDVKLEPYTDFQFKQIGVAPDVDYDKIVLFVDLGRTPAGAEVTIKDFVLVEN